MLSLTHLRLYTRKTVLLGKQGGDFELKKVTLPPLGATMVQVELRMTGLCHTDISMRDNEWGMTDYPLVAGHEGVGEVTHAGPSVRTLSVGDRVGIAWLRDSCHKCKNCQAGRENVCENGFTGTFLGESAGMNGKKGTNEHGGCFVRVQRIEERFAVRIPDALPDAAACPLLCGGATMYEPLCNHARVGSRVGIMGLGGLGRCGLKLAKLRACHVVVVSSSPEKEDAALEAGADEFWCTEGGSDLSKKGGLDLIIDTRPVNAPVMDSMHLLTFEGVFCRVGIPPMDDQGYEMQWTPQIMQLKAVTGSTVTGCMRLNELLQLAADHKDFIVRGDDFDLEVVPFSQINDAMQKLLNQENKGYRYVLKW